MDRKTDINHFYKLLQTIGNNAGMIRLPDIERRLVPSVGMCFYFEEGQYRESGTELRVVRIEHNHQRKDKMTLFDCLLQHRGTSSGPYKGGGNHRNSLFRNYVGTAIMKQNHIQCETWGQGKSNHALRKKEHFMEQEVSRQLGSMFLIILPLPLPGISHDLVQYIERNAISMLSNFHRSAIDAPSPGWLGRYCSNSLVSSSGLWNTRSVVDQYHPDFLLQFEQLCKRAEPGNAESM